MKPRSVLGMNLIMSAVALGGLWMLCGCALDKDGNFVPLVPELMPSQQPPEPEVDPLHEDRRNDKSKKLKSTSS